MKELEFKSWMAEQHQANSRTISSRVSDIKRVENHYGDLDNHFERNKCSELIDLMTYSMEDERKRAEPEHDIIINGNIRTGTANLKKAIVLYCKFREFINN